MPRSPRLEELGLSLHVIAQGIDRCPLFLDDYDRAGFLIRAERIFTELRIETLAWSLMDNHVHFDLCPTNGKVSKGMQRLLGSHATAFNRRHGRVGRLFRDRFWSRPVEDEDDLLGLIGYVILNPLRAGIVRDLRELETYPWTSLAETLRPPARRQPLVTRESTLALFGPDVASAERQLLAMLAGQYGKDPVGGSHQRVQPGGLDALSERDRRDLQLHATHALRLRTRRIDQALRDRENSRGRRLRLERRGWTLDRVVARAAVLSGVEEERLRGGGRRRDESLARCLVAYFAGMYLGCTDAEIARVTGIARPSVSEARGRALQMEERPAWEVFFEIPETEALDDTRT